MPKTKPAADATQAPTETKRQKFLRLANARVVNALSKIELIGNLGGPGYESTEADVTAINNALVDAVEDATERLLGKKAAAAGFSLGE
jgi:hypothetical protein